MFLGNIQYLVRSDPHAACEKTSFLLFYPKTKTQKWGQKADHATTTDTSPRCLRVDLTVI